MPIYTIIGGVNGAGKSSLTGALRRERTDLGNIIDVDKLTVQFGDSAVLGAKTAIRRISECLERGVSFTQETTLSGMKTLRTAKRAKTAGYTVRLYYVGLDSEEEHNKRIVNRVSKGGHDVPAEDVQRRFASRISSLLMVLPYCDEGFFFDNENGFAEVAEYRNGDIIAKGDYRPEWLLALMQAHGTAVSRTGLEE